jgi:hypothetical protein
MPLEARTRGFPLSNSSAIAFSRGDAAASRDSIGLFEILWLRHRYAYRKTDSI